MALPRDTHKKLGTLLTIGILAWIVQLVGKATPSLVGPHTACMCRQNDIA